MEFGSAVLNSISGFYNASDEETLSAKASYIRAKFEQIEVELTISLNADSGQPPVGSSASNAACPVGWALAGNGVG